MRYARDKSPMSGKVQMRLAKKEPLYLRGDGHENLFHEMCFISQGSLADGIHPRQDCQK